MLAIGAGSKEIAQIVGGTSFRRFMDDSFGRIRDVKRVLEEYGWYKGDAFSRWMRQLIGNFAWKADLTFAELGKLIDDNPHRKDRKRLFIVGSDLSLQSPQVFCEQHTPDFPIWEAARISMSIPLFFAAWKRDGRIWVDGGVTWNGSTSRGAIRSTGSELPPGPKPVSGRVFVNARQRSA